MNLLTVLGATCSGKSKMAIEIAQKYIILGQKVAVVNCDSRQIYENLNIGTAKVPGIWQKLNFETKNLSKNSEKEPIACNLQKKSKFDKNLLTKNSQNQVEIQKIQNKIEIKIGLKISDFNNDFNYKTEDLFDKSPPNVCQNWLKKQTQNAFFWENIPHFLIDFVPVNSDYNLVNFVQDWCNLITFWQQNNSFDLVILAGGTGLWAKAIVENYDLGIIKKQHLKTWQKNKTELQNLNLENLQQKYLTKFAKINEKELKITKNLEQKNSQNKIQIKLKTTLKKIKNQRENQTENSANIESVEQNSTNSDLFLLSKENIQKFDEKCNEKETLNEMKNLNNSDFQNPVRLINWLLRHKTLEKNWSQKINYPKFDKIQVVAIKTDKTELNQKIKKSVLNRIKQGLLQEVKNLVENFDRQKIWNLGLEYRESLRLLEEKIDLETWENNLIMQNEQYAKRQITWLNKEETQENLVWVKKLQELEKLLIDLEF